MITEREIYDKFCYDFPIAASGIVKYRQCDDYELLVECNDGSMLMYSIYDRTIRSLPRDSDAMTDDERKHEFCIRLRRLMRKKHVTQLELAQRTGIPRITLNNYINGKTSPSFVNVDKICKALKCSTEELRYVK